MSHITQHIKTKRNLTITGLSAIFILLLLTLSTLLPLDWSENITEAVTGSATLSETSLTMTSSSTTASVDLSILKDNGTFASSANPIKFEVKTTNYSGYTISLSGSSDKLTNTTANGNYTNDSDKYATLSSISTSIDTNTFKADSDASTAYNGKFGISPSKYKSGNTIVNNTSDNATYLPAPTSAITLDETTSANSTAINYAIGLGARASYTQAAGTYVGTYKLTAVGNPINYILTYDKNTTDTVADVPSNKSDSTSQTTITLDSKEPTREGYTFLGWCLGTITTTSNVDSCTGTTYQPGASFGIDQTTENKPTLKAMWEKNGPQSIGYLQDIKLSDCAVNVGANGNSANIGDTLLAYDKRDEKDYTVRYINGYCWMTQNLRFTGTSLNSETSNIASNYTTSSPLTLTYYDLADEVNKTSSGPCYGYRQNSGNGYTNPCIKDSGDILRGAYYNYAAATAGTITSISNSTTTTYDVCPKNWHLPTGPNTTSNTAFNKLIGNTTSSHQSMTTGLTAFDATSAGSYYNGLLNNDGIVGIWWSASTSDAQSRYVLQYKDSDRQFSGNGTVYRYGAFSVRCVKTPSISDATYMQDVTAEMVASMTANQTATLADKRDGQIYTTAKIGNLLWMTRNLAVGCNGSGSTYGSSISSKQLTSSDSNVSSTWSTPTALLSAASSSTQTADYTTPRMQCNATYGGYYNYAAATAGTITGSNNSAEASHSVCPSGWRLPANAEFGTIGTASGSTANVSTFEPGSGNGYYLSGSLKDARSSGFWWSSTAYNTTYRYFLEYYNGNGKLVSGEYSGGNVGIRYVGYSVRCVHP